ncbi:MAG: Uma2 family endonuclease [Cyanobacteria bacterium P01_F01_bin.150]
MIQTLSQTLNADEFIEQYGDQDRYELLDGEVIDLEPTGLHEQVIAFLARKLNVEIDRLDLPYTIPHRGLIRVSDTTAFRPDLIVLDQTQLIHEQLWRQQPVITSNVPIKFIAEVVSTNWQNDYARKVEDYALFGVSEYWITDYLELGGREYIGNPKQPTVTVCQLVKNMYEKRLLHRGDMLESSAFPEFRLEATRVSAAGEG